MTSPTTLYRLFSSGELLYVGVTGNPGRRFEEHRGDKPWWGDVTDIKLEHFPDRLSALAAEREAIIAESPPYNVALNPRNVGRGRSPRGSRFVARTWELVPGSHAGRESVFVASGVRYKVELSG